MVPDYGVKLSYKDSDLFAICYKRNMEGEVLTGLPGGLKETAGNQRPGIHAQECRIPDQKWTIPDQEWTIPDQEWTIPDQEWTIPDQEWTILDQEWSILDQEWSILDQEWSILDQECGILDQKGIRCMPNISIELKRQGTLGNQSGFA